MICTSCKPDSMCNSLHVVYGHWLCLMCLIQLLYSQGACGCNSMHQQELNEELWTAVQENNVVEVGCLIDQGADPDHFQEYEDDSYVCCSLICNIYYTLYSRVCIHPLSITVESTEDHLDGSMHQELQVSCGSSGRKGNQCQ